MRNAREDQDLAFVTHPARRRLGTRLLALVLAAAAMVVDATAGAAQTGYGIAAVVNDEVISSYDVQARLRLMLTVSNIPDSEESRRRLLPQVMRQLIDERLQLQEANRLNIAVTEEEIRGAVTTLERQNQLPPGGLEARLSQDGVPVGTLLEQLRANIAWSKIILRQVRPQVEVGEEEIDEYLAQVRARGGTTEFEAAEVFIPIESTAEETTARQTAQRVVEQARAGVPFAGLAQQFSQAPSAGNGGDLGRVQEGQLDPRLEAALRAMRPGEVSDPIRVENGYYVLQLRDRRQRAVGRAGDMTVALRRIFLPLPPQAGPAEERSQGDLAQTVSETVRGCDDMPRLAQEVGASGAVDVGRLRTADLPARLREVVEALPIGQASQPIRLDDGFLVLMVCDRSQSEAGGNLPSRQEVMQSLGAQRIDMLARRYMRDLRRAAFIDVRT